MVRRWRSWYRWVTLAMLAHAFLVVAALLQRIRHPPPPELIPLTCNEVSHLFVGLAARPLGHLAHRRAPVPATTAARRPGTHEDHDLRLED